MEMAQNSLTLGWSGLSRPDLTQAVYVNGRKGRSRLNEIPHQYHCSIVGTCLSSGEVRKLLMKLCLVGVADMTEGEVHHHAVMVARDRHRSKFINKALDSKYAGAIRLFSRFADTASLRAGWRELAARGDVAGAYWATLSHEHVDGKLSVEIFDQVHMLSHLVSMNVRAETRRVWLLEAENNTLNRKLERQQAHIREGFARRDAEIRDLRRLLAHPAAEPDEHLVGDGVALRRTIRDLHAQLQQQETHAARARERNMELSAEIRVLTERLEGLDNIRVRQQQELEAAEEQLAKLLAVDVSSPAGPEPLYGLTVLYVGGSANQVILLKAAVERAGGAFLHHDGGVESSQSLIPGLVIRADVTVFPVDFVSHGAVHVVKKSCRQAQRPYLPLRVASVSCLVASFKTLRQMGRAPANCEP